MGHRHDRAFDVNQDVRCDPVGLPDLANDPFQVKCALSAVAQEEPRQAHEELVDVSVLGRNGLLDAHVLLPGRMRLARVRAARYRHPGRRAKTLRAEQ